MIRKQMYLEERQQRKLKQLAQARGRTEADVLREAVDALPETDALVARLEAAGLLATMPPLPRALRAAKRSDLEAAAWKLLGDRRETLSLSDAVLDERASARW